MDEETLALRVRTQELASINKRLKELRGAIAKKTVMQSHSDDLKLEMKSAGGRLMKILDEIEEIHLGSTSKEG